MCTCCERIPPIGLIKTPISLHIHFCVCVRTFKFHSLSKSRPLNSIPSTWNAAPLVPHFLIFHFTEAFPITPSNIASTPNSFNFLFISPHITQPATLLFSCTTIYYLVPPPECKLLLLVGMVSLFLISIFQCPV